MGAFLAGDLERWQGPSQRPRSVSDGLLRGPPGGRYLLVNSLGFDGRTWLDRFGNPVSDDMALEERYHRVD